MGTHTSIHCNKGVEFMEISQILINEVLTSTITICTILWLMLMALQHTNTQCILSLDGLVTVATGEIAIHFSHPIKGS